MFKCIVASGRILARSWWRWVRFPIQYLEKYCKNFPIGLLLGSQARHDKQSLNYKFFQYLNSLEVFFCLFVCLFFFFGLFYQNRFSHCTSFIYLRPGFSLFQCSGSLASFSLGLIYSLIYSRLFPKPWLYLCASEQNRKETPFIRNKNLVSEESPTHFRKW